MDTKGFFLGVIVAVVLYLLWKKEEKREVALPGTRTLAGSSPAPVGPCPGSCGCGSGIGSSCPSPVASAPSAMQMLGLDGFISPGAPPLNTAAGLGQTSFYANSGNTPDTGFFFEDAGELISPTVTKAPIAPVNVPGSPTTVANQEPVRARQPVGDYSALGFQQRFNIVGIPRVYASRYIQ